MSKITQKELATFATLKNQIEKLTKDYEVLKDKLIDELHAGAQVQEGERYAELKEVERRSVAWKQVVIRLKSEGYANKVLAATKPVVHYRLVVK